MCNRKLQNSELIKSMVHGKPSRRGQQNSQPCIYDIFNWGIGDDKNKKQVKKQNANQVHENMSKSCIIEQKYNHNKCYNKDHYYQNNQEALPCQRCQQHPIIGYVPQYTKNGVVDQYMITRPKNHLKPHPVKHELYMYDKVHLKRNQSEEIIQNKNLSKKTVPKIIQQNKLNEHDQKDKKTIEKRKQKIKQLPNSAFITYYGRPAFQSYGRCNSNSQLKTHNVMPHRGENHPRVKQTYESALIKGKNVKIEDHLPRKPIQSKHNDVNIDKDKQRKINLPLERPDLINHVRFSEPQPKSHRKQATPSFQKLKYQIDRKKKLQAKKAKNKHKKSTSEESDGLKFMNTRDHLIELIQQKKLKQSKLAYKVTQCYPDLTSQHRKTESQQDYGRPAGISYKRDEPAQNIIYRRY